MAEESEELPELDSEMAGLIGAYVHETARAPAQVEAAYQAVTTQALGASASVSTGAWLTTNKVVVALFLAVTGALVWGVASGPKESAEAAATAEPAEDRAPPHGDPAEVENHPQPVLHGGAERGPAIAPPSDKASAATDLESDNAGVAAAQESARHAAGSRATRPKKRAPPAAAADVPEPPPPASPATSDLAAQLELMRKARAALRGNDAVRALALIRQMKREYPQSTLAEERDASEVTALCALDNLSEAEKKAAAFRKNYTGSKISMTAPCKGRGN